MQERSESGSLSLLEWAALASPTYTYSALGTTAGVQTSAVVIYWVGICPFLYDFEKKNVPLLSEAMSPSIASTFAGFL